MPHLDRSEDSQVHPSPSLAPSGNRYIGPGGVPRAVYGMFTGVPYTHADDGRPQVSDSMSPATRDSDAANAAFADPNFRASVKQMHTEGYPLVRMVRGARVSTTT